MTHEAGDARKVVPTDDEIIALRRATKAQDYTRPFGDTLAFARALLALYAAPAQAEPRECMACARLARPCAEHAAPSPAAEDGLVERLKKWHAEVTEIDLYETSKVALIAEAAARIERQAQEIAAYVEKEAALANYHCESQGCAVPDGYTKAATAYAENFHKMKSERDAALRRAEALREAYQYLQQRLESIGYHGWAHDKDEAIRAQGDDRG